MPTLPTPLPGPMVGEPLMRAMVISLLLPLLLMEFTSGFIFPGKCQEMRVLLE